MNPIIFKQKLEVVQLVVLHRLFSTPASKETIFQGGTALRWGYGGTRLSEDIDLYTSLDRKKQQDLLGQIASHVLRDLAVCIHPEIRLSIKTKAVGKNLSVHWLIFSTPETRKKLRLKLEFYHTPFVKEIETEPKILGMSPEANFFIASQKIFPVSANTMIPFETASGILADKIVAVTNRPYIKGRDFWDIWFIGNALKLKASEETVRHRMKIYGLNKNLRSYNLRFAQEGWPPEKELLAALNADLKRFLSADQLAWLEHTRYQALIKAVHDTLITLKKP